MSKTSIAQSSQARLSATTEGPRTISEAAMEEYQDALCRFDCWSRLEDIYKTARKHGWKPDRFARDVWSQLYDMNFEPWNAVPVLVGH